MKRAECIARGLLIVNEYPYHDVSFSYDEVSIHITNGVWSMDDRVELRKLGWHFNKEGNYWYY